MQENYFTTEENQHFSQKKVKSFPPGYILPSQRYTKKEADRKDALSKEGKTACWKTYPAESFGRIGPLTL